MRILGLTCRGIWTGGWTGATTLVLLMLALSIFPMFRTPLGTSLFFLPAAVTCSASLWAIQSKGPRAGKLTLAWILTLGAFGGFVMGGILFGLAFLKASGYLLDWKTLILKTHLPLLVAWCLWWGCDAVWRTERSD